MAPHIGQEGMTPPRELVEDCYILFLWGFSRSPAPDNLDPKTTNREEGSLRPSPPARVDIPPPARLTIDHVLILDPNLRKQGVKYLSNPVLGKTTQFKIFDVYFRCTVKWAKRNFGACFHPPRPPAGTS